MDVSEKDRTYYLDNGYFEEGSDAYYDFFDGHGWVLQPYYYCEVCKYNNEISEI